MTTFAEHLDAKIKDSNFTAAELCRRMGRSDSYLRHYLKGRDPSLSVLQLIARALGVPTCEIIPPDE